MPIASEILNMLDIGQKPFQSIPSPSSALNRKGKVFPLCDASFRSPNYAHRQVIIRAIILCHGAVKRNNLNPSHSGNTYPLQFLLFLI